MPERSSKRKARRDSVSISLGEPETSILRTENIPSTSDKDFSELSEQIEKSVCRRIKDTEVGQREILRMIELLKKTVLKNMGCCQKESENETSRGAISKAQK